MLQKPWSIRLLALAQLLTPILNVAIGSYLFKISLWTFLLTVIHGSSKFDLVEFFLYGPIAAFAILSVRWWSYPIFLACLLVTMISNYMEWHQHPQLVHFSTLVFCYTLNFLLVSYFLIPRVRQLYFNPRIRWWESKPRYTLMVEGTINTKGKNKACSVVNLSEGGALLETATPMPAGTSLTLTFNCFQEEFKVSGEVVYCMPSKTSPKKHNSGVQFIFTPTTKVQIKRCVKAFQLLGLSRKPAKENKVESFVLFLKELSGALPIRRFRSE